MANKYNKFILSVSGLERACRRTESRKNSTPTGICRSATKMFAGLRDLFEIINQLKCRKSILGSSVQHQHWVCQVSQQTGRESFITGRNSHTNDRDSFASSRDSLASGCNSLMTDRDNFASGRDSLASGCNSQITGRDPPAPHFRIG